MVVKNVIPKKTCLRYFNYKNIKPLAQHCRETWGVTPVLRNWAKIGLMGKRISCNRGLTSVYFFGLQKPFSSKNKFAPVSGLILVEESCFSMLRAKYLICLLWLSMKYQSLIFLEMISKSIQKMLHKFFWERTFQKTLSVHDFLSFDYCSVFSILLSK